MKFIHPPTKMSFSVMFNFLTKAKKFIVGYYFKIRVNLSLKLFLEVSILVFQNIKFPQKLFFFKRISSLFVAVFCFAFDILLMLHLMQVQETLK